MAKKKEAVHSANYENLKRQYEKKYISKATLRGYVALYAVMPSAGITAAEYEEITGEAYG